MHNVQLHPSTSEDRQHETVAADLIPYKVALWRLNTSRTNFWRALKVQQRQISPWRSQCEAYQTRPVPDWFRPGV